jgi:arginyl-tRNA synthetase
MSKRAGNVVLLADLVDAIGVDATRYALARYSTDSPIDLDLDLWARRTQDNPVFYVQYAHARTCSVFRMAASELPALDLSEEAVKAAEIELLATPAELDLVRVLAAWPRTVAGAAVAHEPHRVAFYLHDLAAAFHGFWAKGKEDTSLRFVNPEQPKLTLARLALVEAVRQVLVNGLTLLGVSAPEELS